MSLIRVSIPRKIQFFHRIRNVYKIIAVCAKNPIINPFIFELSTNFHFYFQCSKYLSVENLVLKVEDPDQSYKIIRFSARFPCPICTKNIEFRMTAKLLVNNERGRLNWSLSNFQSHMKLHYKHQTPELLQNNQTPIDRFVASMKPNSTILEPCTPLQSNITDSGPDSIEISDESPELEEVAKVSSKRKFNVISDDENEQNEFSGEAMSGVLAGQNTPDLLCKTMP